MVSVIMPAYNANEKMLRESINSILAQSYTDFELIIVDDGSKDYVNYSFVKNSIADDRVKVFKNDKNYGVANTLNVAISHSLGDYIIRMDSDDIAEKNRIESLVNFMDTYPDVGVAGSFAKTFGAHKKILKYPIDDLDIRIELLYNNAFCHPTVIMRKEIFTEYNIYYSNIVSNEDYNMWVEIAKHPEIKFANIPVCLLNYRMHPDQVTKTKFDKLKSDSKYIVNKALNNQGIFVDANMLDSYIDVVYNYRKINKNEYHIFLSVFEKIENKYGERNQNRERVIQHLSKKNKEIVIKQALCFHNLLPIENKYNKHSDSLLLDFAFFVVSMITKLFE